MSSQHILVVDDDRNLLELLKMRLEASGYEVTTAEDEDRAREKAGARPFDLAVIDLQLVKQDGISLMEDLHRVSPDLPAIILTAHGSIETAVDAMKRGAFTYLTKPFDPRELTLQIERALERRSLTTEVKRLKGILQERYDFDSIIAKSAAMQRVLDLVCRVAPTDSTVLITGESGTGKELIVKAIHLMSDRRDGPFVGVNCAAIPETLLESELFGHVEGAFTGAGKSRKGYLAQADGGTLFLDEIGDMPLSLQAKFLRALQERKFYPLGSETPMSVDLRVVAATNKDLKAEVSEGRFREDLFYRINVIPLDIPPLRERKEDVPSLAEHFLRRYGSEAGKEIKGFTPGAMQKLLLYDWPGNVRELENAVEYAVAMTSEDRITEDYILQTAEGPGTGSFKSLKDAREDFERKYLVDLLRLTRGNVSLASQQAGRYRADFYKLLKKYGIVPDEFKEK